MEPRLEDDPLELGRYRIVGRLGSGGMGQVYLGRDGRGQLAAVKVVHAGLADDPEFRRRFAREVATTRAVRAPWTAAVLDADTDAPEPWLATEYVPGVSLEHAVATSGPLSPDAVAVVAARMAEALAGLHAMSVVHRDVKPSNIMLAEEGPRLIDFGIAVATDGTRITHTGMMVGTPAYMSPEQSRDEPATGASDIFSLASVLTYAATGHGPFGQTANPVAMLLRVAQDDPDLSGVPERLRHTLGACLTKDPAARPTAADLAAELAPTPDLLAAWPPPTVAEYTEQLRRAGAPTAAVPTAAVPTAAVPTVLATKPVLAAEPVRATKRWPVAGVGSRKAQAVLVGGVLLAGVAAAVVLLTSTRGHSVLPVPTPSGPFTTPAQISAAIDTQLHREQTVRTSSVMDIPSEGAHYTNETQLRVDGAGISVQQSGHVHSVYPATGAVLADFDTEDIVLPGQAWCRRVPGMTANGPVSFIEAHPSNDPSDTDMLSCNTVVSGLVELPSFDKILPAVTLVSSADDLLDGVATRRYTVRFDQGALAQLQADPNWRPTATAPQPDPATSTTETLWFDQHDRLLRILTDAPGPAGPTRYMQDTRYHDWGEPVQINPPPAGQIVRK